MGILTKGATSSPDKIDSLIGKDTYFKGTIKAIGIIRIDGRMEGDIETQGDVIVSESGRVIAEIKARSVAVAGHLDGNVYARERLEIRKTGTLIGNISTKVLLIDDGAVFSGGCDMKIKEQDEKKSSMKN
ncbi:MAG: bactofilin family protein [Dethiobacteria bacterium]|jgi:cytoskeletal protein CcmA (bactofilin family)|nr:polymer-forming cytoskeletal protein [Bacillota bacterium]